MSSKVSKAAVIAANRCAASSSVARYASAAAEAAWASARNAEPEVITQVAVDEMFVVAPSTSRQDGRCAEVRTTQGRQCPAVPDHLFGIVRKDLREFGQSLRIHLHAVAAIATSPSRPRHDGKANSGRSTPLSTSRRRGT